MANLPARLIESLKDIKGFNEHAFKATHEAGNQLTSIRLNPTKRLNEEHLPVESTVPWCENGRYLVNRPSFTLDPAFHAGAYYVQEASSMFLHHIIRQIYNSSVPPQHVLDLCAAPGGKSSLLAAALPDSFIVSNEVIKTRVSVLAENISKWGSSNIVVTRNDPVDFKRLPGFFDLMVVDAPCSGSGLFRKDHDAIGEWSEASVQLCSMRQQRILTDAIASLGHNGFLIYSTCSYSKQENEDVADWLINQFHLTPVKINVDPSWGIVETQSEIHAVPCYRFYPDKVQGEGFFITCFQQTNFVDEYYSYHQTTASISRQEKELIIPYIDAPEKYIFFKQQDLIIASSNKWQEALNTITKSLSLRKSGVAIGTVKGKDLIPHHELALSGIISNNIPTVHLDKEQALKYLRRQDLQLKTVLKGWALGTYEHINLGWMKVLPNRVNNYYPTNWRILKS